jgi:hypothetical protein
MAAASADRAVVVSVPGATAFAELLESAETGIVVFWELAAECPGMAVSVALPVSRARPALRPEPAVPSAA